MKQNKSISIRSQLLGDSVTFLDQEGMACLITQQGLVELINQLVSYKEEGKALYPEIYIFDDLDLVVKVLPSSQFYPIGKGEKTKDTMLKALKKCAPLTENGWSIYILREANSFKFGVFKAGTSILSVSISETLIDNGADLLKAILIHQVADRIIEVKGVSADSLIISFGSQEDFKKSPVEAQSDFIEKIVAKVEDRLKEPTRNFYKKVFLSVLQRGHGTLACVFDYKKRSIPKNLRDGIQLDSRVCIPETIREVLDKNDLQSSSMLDGQFSLIVGMMQSDGITVFTNNGEVAGYNVFIKHSSKVIKTTIGGARSRTYLTLHNMVGSDLTSAYIQSQDGKTEYK